MNEHRQATARAWAAARAFSSGGDVVHVAGYGSGHINDTFKVEARWHGDSSSFILQRIHTGIFKDTAALMENIERVTAHLAARRAGMPDCERRALTLIAAQDGRSWHRDAEGSDWRAYRFVGGARTCDKVASARQAYEAAKAFGEFQSLLVDLPSPRLHDTIPDFHNTPKRFKAFEAALLADAVDRAGAARAEIAFAFERRSLADALIDAQLPERIVHNDTKFNNVLFDDVSGEGICVLDLDTVMPGLSVCDFGDMVRTATSPTEEDEQDLSRVGVVFAYFEALLRGYLSAAGSFLEDAEIEHLAVAGKVITFEQGVRFLTDYLSGDTYYKVHRRDHNLERCRTQFKLLESMEQQEERMNGLIGEVMSERAG